jgi:hypothetical protein
MKKGQKQNGQQRYSFNNSVRRGAKALTISAAFATLLTAPLAAMAVPTFAQIAQNGQTTVQSFGSLAIYTGIFLGIIFVIGGIVWWIFAHKRHEPTWPAIAAMIGGFLLSSITTYISSGSSTVFDGTNASQVSQLAP